jgi:molybdenum cofactor biosynthesis enzyme MoaA
MLMHKQTPDPIYVRASVASTCNLNCIYCPKEDGMENRVPPRLKGKALTREEYQNNLIHLARNGIQGISFTGGEPTLNKQLPEFIEFSRKIFNRVELTTNGFALLEIIDKVKENLDLIKISLDATNPNLVKEITHSKKRNELKTALDAIKACCKAGMQVGVNMVVMKSNVSQIREMIALCKNIDDSYKGKIYLSLLDFYFTPQKKEIWEKEFFPLEFIEKEFTNLYGAPEIQNRFGCRFFWYEIDGVHVRFKDSFSATYRMLKCNNCPYYCQEGIYGLKHSVEGWLTTCPVNGEDFGSWLKPGLSSQEADHLIKSLMKNITTAQLQSDSFLEMKKIHRLSLENVYSAFPD